MIEGSRRRLLLVVLLLGLAISAFPGLAQEEDESLQDAKVLYNSALDLKKKGKLEESVQSYEQAVRKNRAILGEDDNGLISALKDSYEKKLASSPADVKLLEGMGFILAVCFSDFTKAVANYEKVIEFSPDEKVKARTRALVERLKIMAETTSRIQDDMAAGQRDERLKEWAEMEKNDSRAVESAQKQKNAAKIAALSSTKDDLEARIPQMEEELKSLEDDRRKAEVLWYSLNDGVHSKDQYYYRKRDRLQKEIDAKKGQIDDSKEKLDNVNKEIDAYDAKQAEQGETQSPKTEGETPNPNATTTAPTTPTTTTTLSTSTAPTIPATPKDPAPENLSPDPGASGTLPTTTPADPAAQPADPADPPLPPLETPTIPGSGEEGPTPAGN